VERDWSAFKAAAPRSILVVPTINKSLDVDAPNYVIAALPVPIAERGYYVFPVNTVKYVLEQEGFYEGDRIHQQPPAALAKLFGSDAVLYVTIKQWDAKYAQEHEARRLEVDRARQEMEQLQVSAEAAMVEAEARQASLVDQLAAKEKQKQLAMMSVRDELK
jgi:hypothetical protein